MSEDQEPYVAEPPANSPTPAERVAIHIDALKRLAGPDAEGIAKALAEWCYKDAAKVADSYYGSGRAANAIRKRARGVGR